MATCLNWVSPGPAVEFSKKLDGWKPYKFIGIVALDGWKPYEFIGINDRRLIHKSVAHGLGMSPYIYIYTVLDRSETIQIDKVLDLEQHGYSSSSKNNFKYLRKPRTTPKSVFKRHRYLKAIFQNLMSLHGVRSSWTLTFKTKQKSCIFKRG